MILSGLGASAFDRRSVLRMASAGAAGLATGMIGHSARADDPPNAIDLSTVEGQLKAWVKLDGTLEDGGAAFGMWDGVVFSVMGQDEAPKPLFGFVGIGASRFFNPGDGTYTKLHREVGVYTDLETGEILEEWANPYLDGEKVKVWPVNNDPVNVVLQPVITGGYDPNFRREFVLPWYDYGDDRISTSFDVNLRWPNLLTKEEWPREFTGEWVRVGEYFQSHASRATLLDPDIPSAVPSGGWQRIGPYLPWMLMEERPGHLFYRANTGKLPKGPDQLPPKVLAYVEKNYPKYLEAPDEWIEPNVSSFEVYKRDASPVAFPAGRVPYRG